MQLPFFLDSQLPLGLFLLFNPLDRDVIITDLAHLRHKGIKNLRVLVEKLGHWDFFSLQTELHIAAVLSKYWRRSWLGG